MELTIALIELLAAVIALTIALLGGRQFVSRSKKILTY